MPRYGAHIILPWMTGAGKAYSDEQHPPTVSVPHFDFLETYDCLFTDFIPDFITFADMNMTRSLWADGHLAYSLTPQGMETYLCDRLRIQTKGGHRPEVIIRDNMFLVYSRTLRDAPPCPPCMYNDRGRPFWLIDYVVEPGSSIIVPQQLNMLNSPMASRARLNLPQFFHNKRGGLGVTVRAAAASASPGIQGEETIFEAIRSVTTTHLVLHWPGYTEFTKQTETKISNTKEPHTIGRFVHHIGLFMKKFLSSPPPITDPHSAWLVDEGWMNTLYIVGVVQVTQGRWQPILRIGY